MKWFEAFRRSLTPRERDAPQTEEAGGGAAQGERYAQLSADGPFERLELLTPRELDLFLILLEGYTLKESAKKLDIKYSTANTHMTGIYKKLNVNSRAELIIRYRDAVKRIE